MATPFRPGEVFLKPDECACAHPPTRLRTVLGSCVAITMWDPHTRKGGMAHCVLPARPRTHDAELNPRFVDEAVLRMLREAVRAGIDPSRCVFKVFGGSRILDPGAGTGPNGGRVGDANAAMATRMLEGIGADVQAKDLGGTVYRSLVFDLATGEVWVRYGDRQAPKTLQRVPA